MGVARYMVQGCDVWLNTPLRPLEASGTSGMKAQANGAINVSTLDGWWDEAWQHAAKHDVGWAIGNGESYADPAQQDEIERRRCINCWNEAWYPHSTNAARMACL